MFHLGNRQQHADSIYFAFYCMLNMSLSILILGLFLKFGYFIFIILFYIFNYIINCYKKYLKYKTPRPSCLGVSRLFTARLAPRDFFGSWNKLDYICFILCTCCLCLFLIKNVALSNSMLFIKTSFHYGQTYRH